MDDISKNYKQGYEDAQQQIGLKERIELMSRRDENYRIVKRLFAYIKVFRGLASMEVYNQM
ncbi:MAG: hypothetical protein JM58_07385 [Peptococcaceae bacterium BICA1-8]|nr:MAG: hypothetical protein JM58_07385 [Peptococcaceae bacterium BICA1-8]